jgi:hypothetical protein
MTDTATSLLGDICEDAAQVAATLGLTAKFRHVPYLGRHGAARQLTVYGSEYDGTDRSSRLTKKADKVRVTDYGDHAVILTLTGNNSRVGERQVHAETEPDRPAMTEMLAETLGAIS